VSFQSLFGKEEWLKPYTDRTVERAGEARACAALDVLCPGFSADCLETIEEIDQLNREIFLHHGGEHFRFIPASTNATIISIFSPRAWRASSTRGWAKRPWIARRPPSGRGRSADAPPAERRSPHLPGQSLDAMTVP
jgi:hypothetical protein